MIPIRGRRALMVLLTVVLAASGCGLSDELDREVDPGRTGESRPTLSFPPAGTPSAGASAVAGPYLRLDGARPGESASAPASPSSPSSSCPPSGARIRPEAVSAAMGLRATTVTLVNCGAREYRLNGYPRLVVLDEHREPLDVQILEGTEPVTTGRPDPGPHPVTLKPGESAYTVLVWRNTVTDTTTTAVSGTYLRVTPAEGRPSETVTPEGRIDLGNTGRIGTTAWEKSP